MCGIFYPTTMFWSETNLESLLARGVVTDGSPVQQFQASSIMIGERHRIVECRAPRGYRIGSQSSRAGRLYLLSLVDGEGGGGWGIETLGK